VAGERTSVIGGHEAAGPRAISRPRPRAYRLPRPRGPRSRARGDSTVGCVADGRGRRRPRPARSAPAPLRGAGGRLPEFHSEHALVVPRRHRPRIDGLRQRDRTAEGAVAASSVCPARALASRSDVFSPEVTSRSSATLTSTSLRSIPGSQRPGSAVSNQVDASGGRLNSPRTGDSSRRENRPGWPGRARCRWTASCEKESDLSHASFSRQERKPGNQTRLPRGRGQTARTSTLQGLTAASRGTRTLSTPRA